MRLFLLSDPLSSHTIKWVNALLERDIEIFLFGFSKIQLSNYRNREKLHFYSMAVGEDFLSKPDGNLSKIVYLKSLIKLKKLIKEFSPHILHAHYASSYGLIGALTNFHPFIISVWGSDIYNFPKKSNIHRAIIRFNLSRSDKILSTSTVMKEETKKYTPKEILITPFGVDTRKFYFKKENSFFNSNDIVIGTIKTLENKYGIEHLINAFKLVKEKFSNKPLKLLIVGQGSQLDFLKNLVKKLRLENETIFTGYINHDEVHIYHNMMDIFVSVSVEDSESFGVSVLEASACGKPVVVSNVGGFLEIVEHEKTGFIVQKENPEAIADAISRLIEDEQLRKVMGTNGRQKVIKEYDWEDSVRKMISIYNSLVN